MEGDRLCLDLALLHVDLVAAEDDGDVLAHTDEITWGKSLSVMPIVHMDTGVLERLTVPVGDVLVCDTGGDIEHDDAALAVDVVAIAKTAELLLASGVPDVELNRAVVL